MKLTNLSKVIDQEIILEAINLTIPKGVIFGIVGRNGSGKTTLFRTIAGHYLPDSGLVTIDQKAIQEFPYLKEAIFYSDTQFHPFDYMTPRTIGEYYQALYETFDSSLYQQLVADYQLPNKRYQQYSKGMQGLLMVIAAYASNCKYLIFDEPLDGLDVMIRKQVIDLLLDTISEGQRSILISSHNLVELEKIVDQVAFLKNHTISSTLELEQRKLMTKKIQFVFKQKEIPQTVKDYGRILSVNGRVVIGIGTRVV